MGFRLQIRSFEIPEVGWVDQYRWVRESNGWGPRRWQSTPHRAYLDLRRLLRTG